MDSTNVARIAEIIGLAYSINGKITAKKFDDSWFLITIGTHYFSSSSSIEKGAKLLAPRLVPVRNFPELLAVLILSIESKKFDSYIPQYLFTKIANTMARYP